MRHIIATSLLIVPMLLPAAAVASQPATDDSASTSLRPVSTGVIPAHVIYSPNVELPSTAAAETIPNEAEVVVQLNVDKRGATHDVEVVKSINPELDAPVVAAVNKFRFRPATLDNQPVEVPMTLTVVVQR